MKYQPQTIPILSHKKSLSSRGRYIALNYDKFRSFQALPPVSHRTIPLINFCINLPPFVQFATFARLEHDRSHHLVVLVLQVVAVVDITWELDQLLLWEMKVFSLAIWIEPLLLGHIRARPSHTHDNRLKCLQFDYFLPSFQIFRYFLSFLPTVIAIPITTVLPIHLMIIHRSLNQRQPHINPRNSIDVVMLDL